MPPRIRANYLTDPDDMRIMLGETRVVKVNPDADDHAKRFGCFSDHYALYVDCACGGHLLEGQIDYKDDGDSLIGIYPENTITAAHIADKRTRCQISTRKCARSRGTFLIPKIMWCSASW